MSNETSRRLAAILSADVVGYSRLMQQDDRATLAALTERRRLFSEHVTGRGGRIVNAPGDSILAEISSVVEAVECALEIQKACAVLDAAVPDERRMRLRIGVNVGDVLVDPNGALYGDGVNIAARLEALAPPAGICVSKAVHDEVKSRLRLEFEDLGEKALKNIASPVHVFNILPAGAPAVAVATVRPNSIAVLAFDNMTGDPGKETFCDGISEDIITDVSKTNGIAVTGRQSAFAYKGKAGDLRKVGRELGVRYVLEGSVRMSGNLVRVTAQLIDAETGTHVWANRYDHPLDDVFLLGDAITEDIVTALDVKLSHGEEARIWRKAMKRPAAREAFTAGMNAYYLGTPQGMRQARELFLRAGALEPDSAWPVAMAAMTHCYEVMHGATSDPARALVEAQRLAEHACRLDDTIPSGHGALGLVALFEGRHDEALERARRAEELRPMCAGPKAIQSYVQLYCGLWGRAVRSAEDAVELNPVFPIWYRYLAGAAWHFAGRHEDALATLRKVSAANPKLILARLATIGADSALGRTEQAAAEARTILQDRPDFSVNAFARTQPFRDKALRERYLDSLRANGLPD